MPRYNDLDMQKWHEYEDVLTTSLWTFQRENSGVHNANYHGNFIPQVPRQLFTRYTKKGDWILDPFMGSGTSLIEAQRMGRNSIGIELQAEVAQEVTGRLRQEYNPNCSTNVWVADSKTVSMENILQTHNIKKYQFAIFHPPYWDIIKFSENENDLSNTKTLDEFLDSFGQVIDNTTKYLEKNRYCAVVIGDKYANSQIVPLGFHCMNLFLQRGFMMKAILVKNFDKTRGKMNQKAIWRYRALASDFYIFDHEYIFVFKKVK
jgi:hypothetical protein